jgi:hypothetical protein
MSIKKYTNFDAINSNKSNQGEFLLFDDNFIVTKNEVEATDFGDCKYDVMEVSIYDINNNLIPNKTGKTVAYIKTGDIKNYVYNLTNAGGQGELAIDIEKLLNDLGFTNGILKVIINFVRNRIGSDNELTRVWIHEISPSREEIRILPLKTQSDTITKQTQLEFNNLNNLTKDFKYHKKNILDILDSFEVRYLESVTDAMVARFGNDFLSVLRKDFGLSDFDSFKKRIFVDFKNSVTYWLNNRYYNISESNFGKVSETRFINCEQYEFKSLVDEIRNILRNCIDYHTKTLKRRAIAIEVLPKEFEITQLKKEVKDLVGNISINEDRIRKVYRPDKVELNIRGSNITTTIISTPPTRIPQVKPVEIKLQPKVVIDRIELQEPRRSPARPMPIEPINPSPIKILKPPVVIEPPIDVLIPTPIDGGGSSGRTLLEPYTGQSIPPPPPDRTKDRNPR